VEAYLSEAEANAQGLLKMSYGFEFRGPMTLEQFEQEIVKETPEGERKDTSLAFLDVINERWLHRKGYHYIDGDEFCFFRTGKHSWDSLVGSAGYLLLREGKIIDVLLTVAQ